MMQLQNKDMELKRLLGTRKSIPSKIDENDLRLAEERSNVTEKEEELTTLAKKRRACEKDLEALEEKIKEKEGRLLKVGNNKEYQALLTEINNARELQSNIEGDLLRMMEQEEALMEAVQEAQRSLEPRAAEIERFKKELRKELDRNESLIPALERDRERIAGTLRQDVRSRYERIANGKAGLAVVAVKKRACGGCFTALPAQMINEIKRNDRLITCEHCGRVLVWDEGANGEGGSA